MRLLGALVAAAVAIPLGALTALSSATAATTSTVYYPQRSDWTTTNIHYGVDGAAWTTVPGVPMEAACTGWLRKEIDLGSASGVQLTFNNGSGTWDNNRGANYRVGSGIVVVKDGAVTTGTAPCATTPSPTPSATPSPTTSPTTSATLYYRTDWTAPRIHYQVGSGAWTTVPGVVMTSACTGWFAFTIDLGAATGGQVVFNNGSGTWDNNRGANYRYATGLQTVSGGTLAAVTTSPCAPTPTPTPTPSGPDTVAPTVPAGLVATADGVRVTIGWAASSDAVGVTGYTLTRTGGAGIVARDVATATATDVNLLPRTSYTYSVTAYDAAGNRSAASASATVTTGDAPTATTGEPLGGDPREDSIYFVMTARFDDGVPSNNRGGSQNTRAGNGTDTMFRGDFQGLVDKLDYVKALGFSAIWITPVVLNRSDYDFHGYHGWDFYRVDTRLETPGATYQDLIDTAHAKGMKIYQDVVYNHTSRWGAKGLFVPTVWGARDGQWDWMYSAKEEGREYDPMDEATGNDPTLTAAQNLLAKGRPYNGDLWSSTATAGSTCANFGTLTGTKSAEGFSLHNCQWPSPTSGMFPSTYYHQCWIGNWEGKDAQDCWLHEDLADLNTESKPVQDYLIGAYNQFIDMGVDGFRIDTAVHIPRVTWNRVFLPAIQQHATAVHGEKGKDFYVFGEVAAFVNDKWNRGSVNHSAQFYTWKERREYSVDDVVAAAEQFQYENLMGTGNQPTSTNAFLTGTDGNTYHAADHSKFSGMNVIDMRMHMNFGDANNAYWNGKDSDDSYNDATYNVVYVDSHDYGPNKSTVRYNGGTDAWAENMSLMWTFRGIPTLYYGSEIEFQAGKPIDCGPTCPLATTGRAYYGDNLAGSVVAADFGVVASASGAVATTLQKPLVKHVQRLNLIRRAVPALQKGQYSTVGVQGNMAYKRRFTEGTVDSFVLVTVTDGATFGQIPNGTYVDVVTGDRRVVTTGSLSIAAPGKGNLRAYVLELPGNPAPGKVGVDGPYLR
ncbi:alpha-amylase [Cellulomonas composti]|uniref:Alpha-amylase n=2 Tax=Cellulomonas composti TaxID=266130 RepID=A0A511J9H8_9CELL|nr:alpha-amylase [Cellulomonas composti]